MPSRHAQAVHDVLACFFHVERVEVGGGDDSLMGDADADTLVGGSGSDTLEGGSGADRLVAGTEADSLDGGSENDTLFGEDGDDTLRGGEGADDLRGGAGLDTCWIDNAGDIATGNTGRDTARFETGSALDINISGWSSIDRTGSG